MGEIVFEARGVSKFFPGVKALENVSIKLTKGSIHALLGENGAGKSTLIKLITGVYRPDEGELLLDGKPTNFFGPRDAMAAGIGVVHQERNLIPRFSVGENIMLEQSAGSLFKPIDYRQINADAKKWLDMLGLDVDPSMRVSQLSVAKMQLVEIAKALSLRSRVLLLDEPTASLSPHETIALFALLKKLRDEGVSMLFVSHKLEEVQSICDSVTVLRDGHNACESRSMAGLGRQDLVKLMIGRSEQIPDWAARDFAAAPPVLELKDVATPLGHQNIDLTVRKGEIVGLYGLIGAGRTELAKSIMGLFPVNGGSVKLDGQAVTIGNVADAIHTHRIGYVSEDRKQEGLILMHTVLDNAGIAIWRRVARKFGLLTDQSVRVTAEPFIRKLEVRTPSLNQIVGNLSGGNQQKISVAKWLAAGVRLLIVDEPTVGIDIKTKAYLHELLRDLSNSGTAILLITSDMPEMITLADRIVVMNDYRLAGELHNTRDYAAMSEGIMHLIHRVAAA
ncbi:sugar ABC transporter ATP-binding protein [Kaistia dalseonensis]|uniref:Ribose transport system ATP-binding protein n=1 Tax=Kaistia dalseonensis TaxID=410840 RepID=A0ABU0H8W0_9HYPH|nr:sugar ABC transporter ATP-binding protein [Kaistia dalseonensis]MCX5496144.1 sugar ABC transporter ATP-binding protein [Kaistia dalseonensis]MDQ0438753.1 ribose transport system ATP-binding protein [Kaistia dalseonensis]